MPVYFKYYNGLISTIMDMLRVLLIDSLFTSDTNSFFSI